MEQLPENFFASIKFLSTLEEQKLKLPHRFATSVKLHINRNFRFQLQRNGDRQTRRGRELTRWRRAYKRSSIVHHPPLEDSVAYINPFVPPFPTIKYSNSSSIEFRVIKLSRERERLFLKCFARAHTRTYTLHTSRTLSFFSLFSRPLDRG